MYISFITMFQSIKWLKEETAFSTSLIFTSCPLCLKPREQGRQLKRIHWVSNIGTALKFLEGRKVSIQSYQQFHLLHGNVFLQLYIILEKNSGMS